MSAADTIVRHLYRSLGADRSDPDLLNTYTERRCDDAFRALVARHGPAVLGVCRRHLGDLHAAEDAFQATFLLLARRAAAVRRPEALSAWLFRTALRVCGRARSTRDRRRTVEANVPPRTVADPVAELSARELLAAMDNELNRLPERYRLPLALVYWQGLTHVEAGRRLGLTPGALHGRLDRGRARLAARLTRRGFAPIALLAAPLASATLTSDLLAATVAIAADPWSKTLPATLLSLVAVGASGKLAAVTGLFVTLVGFGLVGAAAQSPSPPVPPKSERPAAAIATVSDVDRFGDPLPPGAVARLGTMRLRHAGAMRVVPMPDGKTLISFGTGPTARLWDLATGRLVREFGQFPSISHRASPALSPNGNWFAVPSAEAVQVWDVTTGRLVYAATDEGWMTETCAFSPDSQLLASGGHDGHVRIREAETGKLLRIGRKHRERVSGLIFRDPDTLLSGGDDGTVIIWDVPTATVRNEIKAGTGALAAIALNADGTMLATGCCGERMIRLWKLPAASEITSFFTEHQLGSICPLAFTPDGKSLATGAATNGTIKLYDVSRHGQRKLPLGPEMPKGPWVRWLSSLAFSPDGRSLFGPDFRSEIHCLDVKSRRNLFANEEHAFSLGDVCFTADGKRVVTNSLDAFIRSYDLTGRMLKRQQAGFVSAFAPGGRIAFVKSDNEWWLTEPDTGRTWGRTKYVSGVPSAVVFAPDGRTFAVLNYQPDQSPGPVCVVQLHDSETGKVVRTMENAGFGRNLKFTPDGRILALAEHMSENINGGLRLHLWDTATGRTTDRVINEPGWLCSDFAFSPDSRFAAVSRIEPRQERQAGEDRKLTRACVGVFEVPSGRERQRLQLEPTERPNEILSVRYSTSGRHLALGLDDGTVRLWELASGEEQRCFAGNAGSATSLALSPDGRLLASVHGVVGIVGRGGEGSVLLWQLSPDPGHPLPTDRAERDTLWKDLGGPAAKAGQVKDRLASDRDGAAAIIRERLTPASAPNAEQLRQLIADLDSSQFATRTKAVADLQRLRGQAGEALRQTRTGKPSAEVRLQIERLLAKLESPGEPPEVLRAIRAVEVLEMIDTADARRLLTEFAKGDPAARLTREAQGSLDRLRGRGDSPNGAR